MGWRPSYEQIINNKLPFRQHEGQHGIQKWSYLRPQAVSQNENLTQASYYVTKGTSHSKGPNNLEITLFLRVWGRLAEKQKYNG